jgi:Flp pilus assembly secretin CpaC
MHRTFLLPRRLGWWSLIIALTLHVGIQTASAQTQAPGQASPVQRTVIELPVGSSRAHSMSTRTDLKRVENPDSSVVRVERIPNKNNEIMLVAESPGRCLITFVDQRDRVEVYEVVVAAPIMAVAAQPNGGVQDVQGLQIIRGGFKTVRLRDVPTGGISNENSKVVRVIQSKDDLRVITFEGLDMGRSRVTFVSGDAKDHFEVFDITVIGPETKGVHQVQLEVLVAVVNRSKARQMSFSWNVNGNNMFVSSVLGGPFTFANALNPSTTFQGAKSTFSSLSSTGTANILYGVLNKDNSFQFFLQALRTEGLSKILAEPRIVTLSGTPATIIAGGQVPILTSGGTGTPSVDYKDFGTKVNFLPIVLPNNKVQIKCFAEISDVDASLSLNIAGVTPTSIPGFRKRSADVTVQIEDGQTLAIGGLIQNNIDATITRVPVLGDLPYLGAAFSTKSYTDVEQELIILVTPRLVEPVDCTKIPRDLPGRETRKVDDFELFLEGILEAPRRPRYVQFHPYQGAHMLAPNIGQYPCYNGNGYYGGNGNGYVGGGCANGNCGGAAPPAMTTTPKTAGTPSFPDVPASGPGSFPPIREIPSGTGLPMQPGTSIGQPDYRPSLPPIPGGR